ncbi:DUF2621 family protein [Bacillus sp. Marseille-P3661]|uniref:DUF2621 family protein n=1 Tax=Bacillus sp. Marseille-P3661 TaxID=1936234 RepID=UPI000C8566DA|nr:DUF2621 family protein [Bacillus sp. Marseille-P3661]
MFDSWIQWLIFFWTIFMISMLFIGGYFMFRKFLKRLPKEDGKSIMDWEEHYLKETRHLWPQEQKDFLEELVKPVPELFRDVARQKIAAKIGEIALEKQAAEISQELVIQGYIKATPKRDHKFLRKTLKEKEIDLSTYEHYF